MRLPPGLDLAAVRARPQVFRTDGAVRDKIRRAGVRKVSYGRGSAMMKTREMKETHTFGPLSILLLNEGGAWVLQCLQYDIAGQGKTIEDAKVAFRDAFVGQVIVDCEHGRKPLAQVPRAPRWYWDEFHEATKLVDPFEVMASPEVAADVPPPWMIHAMCTELRLSG